LITEARLQKAINFDLLTDVVGELLLQFASSAAVAPGMIIEALQEAISSRT
jgi:hypothetical protein